MNVKKVCPKGVSKRCVQEVCHQTTTPHGFLSLDWLHIQLIYEKQKYIYLNQIKSNQINRNIESYKIS